MQPQQLLHDAMRLCILTGRSRLRPKRECGQWPIPHIMSEGASGSLASSRDISGEAVKVISMPSHQSFEARRCPAQEWYLCWLGIIRQFQSSGSMSIINQIVAFSWDIVGMQNIYFI